MNIVFDLGGVVFTWEPEKLIKSVFEDNEAQENVKSKIFAHPDWVQLDRGTLSRDEAVERGAMRTGLPISKIGELMLKIPGSLLPIKETISLIHSVKRSGNKVFVLSNMHSAVIKHIEKEYSFWDIFDGIIISCRIHLVKPEAAIYQYLMNEYGLTANETIFIDDTDINLDAASKLGISTIKFQNAKQCEDELIKFGCI